MDKTNVVLFQSRLVSLLWSPRRGVAPAWRLRASPSVVPFPFPVRGETAEDDRFPALSRIREGWRLAFLVLFHRQAALTLRPLGPTQAAAADVHVARAAAAEESCLASTGLGVDDYYSEIDEPGYQDVVMDSLRAQVRPDLDQTNADGVVAPPLAVITARRVFRTTKIRA